MTVQLIRRLFAPKLIWVKAVIKNVQYLESSFVCPIDYNVSELNCAVVELIANIGLRDKLLRLLNFKSKKSES